MASRLLGVAFEATEFFSPLLQKIGISKWFKYLDLTSLIRGALINPRQMLVWFKELQLSSKAVKVALVGWATSIVWDDVESKIDELYDEYGGDVKAYLLALFNTVACETINEQVSQRLNVEINLTKLFPINDRETLEEILYQVGRVVAQKLNQSHGTNFDSVYPIEPFMQAIKAQLITELTSGTRKILDNEDVASFIDGLNRVRGAELTEPYNHGGVVIVNPNSVDAILAEKRYYNRLRQRKYRLTHERVSHAWKLKGT